MNAKMKADLTRSFGWSALAATLLVTGSCAILAVSLLASHERAEAEAGHTLENLTFNLEQNFHGQIRSADLVLQSAQRAHARLRSVGALDVGALSEVMRGLQPLLPGSTAFRGADRTGAVIFGEGADVRPRSASRTVGSSPMRARVRGWSSDCRSAPG